MVEDALRVIALAVWAIVFLTFSPGAYRALRGVNHSDIDLLCLPGCFSALNRLLFTVTALFAPALAPIAQATGIVAGAWLAASALKVVRYAR